VLGAAAAAVDDFSQDALNWQPLADRTGAGQDMSFVLFQQAQILGPPPKEK